MSASENKWLIVGEGVKLTPTIEPVIEGLDAWFEADRVRATVTSGFRDPKDQLRLIQHYAELYRIDQEFPEIAHAFLDSQRPFEVGGPRLYEWQRAWSRLLNIGVIINPPREAKVLFDYHHPRYPETNRKGRTIGPSPHNRGTAFDIGGGDSIFHRVSVMQKAFESGALPIRGYLVERSNNCVHVDCI